MVMVIFDGLTVTPEIRMLIEKYHIGNILLTSRNIRGIYKPPTQLRLPLAQLQLQFACAPKLQ
jgi:hypothetical protein